MSSKKKSPVAQLVEKADAVTGIGQTPPPLSESAPLLDEALAECRRFLRKADKYITSNEFGAEGASPLRAGVKRASMDATRALAAWRKEN